jgi:NTE family protein
MSRRGLVLGGGGITGIAWELGFLLSIMDSGLDIRRATGVMGTSAGSVTGTLLLTKEIEELRERLARIGDQEITNKLAKGALVRSLPGMALPRPQKVKRAALGTHAAKAQPIGGQQRMEAIRRRIGVAEWPEQDLRITAVNAETGELSIFTKDSGVDITHAVAASCAVPFVWPPVSINDTLYIDGGMRTPTNVDKMTGFNALLVLAPIEMSFPARRSARKRVARTGATRTLVVTPDEASRKAIGRNVLDPARAAAAGQAGLAQGERYAERVTRTWEAWT